MQKLPKIEMFIYLQAIYKNMSYIVKAKRVDLLNGTTIRYKNPKMLKINYLILNGRKVLVMKIFGQWTPIKSYC